MLSCWPRVRAPRANSAMQVNVVDGAHDVAAGTFDMSAHPVAIPRRARRPPEP